MACSTTANADTGTINTFPSIDPYNIGKDYGRAVFDVRYRLFLFGNSDPSARDQRESSDDLFGRHAVQHHDRQRLESMTANTTTGRCLARPTALRRVRAGTNTIAGCGSFVSPPPGTSYTPIPINYCTGPNQFTTNLRITKTFGFGQSTGAARPRGKAREVVRGGPGGPGGPGGGGRGGPGGGGAVVGRRPVVALAVARQHGQTLQPRLRRSGTEPVQQCGPFNAEWNSDVPAVRQIDATCRTAVYQQLRFAADFAADVLHLLIAVPGRLKRAQPNFLGCARFVC